MRHPPCQPSIQILINYAASQSPSQTPTNCRMQIIWLNFNKANYLVKLQQTVSHANPLVESYQTGPQSASVKPIPIQIPPNCSAYAKRHANLLVKSEQTDRHTTPFMFLP